MIHYVYFLNRFICFHLSDQIYPQKYILGFSHSITDTSSNDDDDVMKIIYCATHCEMPAHLSMALRPIPTRAT